MNESIACKIEKQWLHSANQFIANICCFFRGKQQFQAKKIEVCLKVKYKKPEG